MLYYLHFLTDVYSPLRVFRYITFRAFLAAALAFVICLVVGPALIRFLRRLKLQQQGFRQDDAPDLAHFHKGKAGTPIMGGLLIVFSVTVATVLCAALNSMLIWLTLGSFIFMGMIGFADDYKKIMQPKSKGLRPRTKFALQIAWALLLGVMLWFWPETHGQVKQLMLPFLKDPLIADMGFVGSLAFVTLIVVGCTNAVNLTDGLDGLAIGCSNSVALSYLVMAYAAGNMILARYLQIPYVAGAGELAVFCAALLGGGLGFLWFNCHPAQVFMGDTGSLALGGALATVALLVKQELVLVIVGGVFVVEALSVLMQVASFKLTGRRIFKCAPLHHHYEILEKEAALREGRPIIKVETQITIRFWIISIICALIGIATLKIR